MDSHAPLSSCATQVPSTLKKGVGKRVKLCYKDCMGHRNREEGLAKRREWRRSERGLEGARRSRAVYEKTFEGHLRKRYWNMRRRQKGTGGHRVKRSWAPLLPQEEFLSWGLASMEYRNLYALWVESGFNRKLTPTVDRKDAKKGYVLGNIQWLTFSQNSLKGKIEHPRKSKSGMPGIEIRVGRKKNRYIAKYGNKRLGSFLTLAEAQSARAKAVIEAMKGIPL
jgi:hypothetical protein